MFFNSGNIISYLKKPFRFGNDAVITVLRRVRILFREVATIGFCKRIICKKIVRLELERIV